MQATPEGLKKLNHRLTNRPRPPYLPLVELLGCGRSQAKQSVVLEDGAWSLPHRSEALHLRHVVQALFHVTKVARLRRRFLVRTRVFLDVVILTGGAALQAGTLRSQFNLTLRDKGRVLNQLCSGK